MDAEALYQAAGSPGVPWHDLAWEAAKLAGILLLLRFMIWLMWA